MSAPAPDDQPGPALVRAAGVVMGAQSEIAVRVKAVDRVVDLAAGTFDMHLELPNAREALPGGIRCMFRIAGVDG